MRKQLKNLIDKRVAQAKVMSLGIQQGILKQIN